MQKKKEGYIHIIVTSCFKFYQLSALRVITVTPGSKKDLEKIGRGRTQLLQVKDFDVHQAFKARKGRYNGTSPKGK